MKYCPHCGLDLSLRTCPHCAAEVQPDWSFCVDCGGSIDDDPSEPVEESEAPPAKQFSATTVMLGSEQREKLEYQILGTGQSMGRFLGDLCLKMREAGSVPPPVGMMGSADAAPKIKVPTDVYEWIRANTTNLSGSIRAALEEL